MSSPPSSPRRSAFDVEALGDSRRHTIGGVKLRLAWLVVLALPCLAGAAPGLQATLSAPGHTPKVNAKWFYVVRATAGGKPVKATITSQIVDPVGGVHAVEFGDTHRFVTNRPFTGTFRDFVRFPPESQGIKLKFRVIVKAGAARRSLTYWIRAR
jgi:hypothetical protein